MVSAQNGHAFSASARRQPVGSVLRGRQPARTAWAPTTWIQARGAVRQAGESIEIPRGTSTVRSRPHPYLARDLPWRHGPGVETLTLDRTALYAIAITLAQAVTAQPRGCHERDERDQG